MPTERRDLSFLPPEVLTECGWVPWPPSTDWWQLDEDGDADRSFRDATQADEDMAVGVMVQMLGDDRVSKILAERKNWPGLTVAEALAAALKATKEVGDG